MRLDEACAATFARHETFHPRYGWFKKAYDGAMSDPAIFASDRATVQLGVGKNMVRAIRFWGHAARVLAAVPNPQGGRLNLAGPSRIGHALFDDEGWDPYCEDPGTLWLIHWLLLAPPCQLPVWWALFHEFSALEFTDIAANEFAEDHIGSVSAWSPPHPSSITKDVTCLLRTYTQTDSSARTGLDDLLDCPLRDLGLLRAVGTSRRTFRFAVGEKPTLPGAVVLYSALDFLARTDARSQTSTVSRLASEPGGPGRAFRLTESSLAAELERAAASSSAVDYAVLNGVAQLSWKGSAATAATDVLTRYYAAQGSTAEVSGLLAGREADEAIHDYNLAGRSI